MKKHHWQILLFIIVVIIMASCAGTLKTRYYTIQEIRGKETVVFKELPNDAWHVPGSDTLQIGQKIYLQRVFNLNKANVW